MSHVWIRRVVRLVVAVNSVGCMPPRHHTLARLAAGCPPVTSDPRWNDIQWSAREPDGSQRGQVNAPPAMIAGFDPRWLMGSFDVVAVATAGLARDDRDPRAQLTVFVRS